MNGPVNGPAGGVLRADGLEVRYGDLVAVAALDLVVAPGQFLAVTGPSGAGKSSLLWALGGALRPSAGGVRLADQPVTDRATAAEHGLVLVPQGNGLATSLTATENVLVPLLVHGTAPADAARRTAEALALVGLEDSGGHLVEELSGGQQQRVALARAFAARARVLLADEPTSDLDAGNRVKMVTALRAEAERGSIVVMSTHDPEAAAECDGELALDEGQAQWVRRLDRVPTDRAPGHGAPGHGALGHTDA
ncbi:ATP-binding cassette domain-containing protein [Nocardioides terrisoli]|uniref:ATP-binding cassette domain-containing protein n=1 Tax=Nocardioides terrisoli TaxID=3388267 RepID=UPI00287B7658|nr:ATP-binding cassette domain-containing protein [Nocardioides marmorisolisilvae]